MVTFLGLNGYEFDATEADVVAEILGLAEGRVSGEMLADWIRRHSSRRR
jgi:prophage maintenance system killer protein